MYIEGHQKCLYNDSTKVHRSRLSHNAYRQYSSMHVVGGYGLEYGAACARRTGQQKVEIGSTIPMK